MCSWYTSKFDSIQLGKYNDHKKMEYWSHFELTPIQKPSRVSYEMSFKVLFREIWLQNIKSALWNYIYTTVHNVTHIC